MGWQSPSKGMLDIQLWTTLAVYHVAGQSEGGLTVGRGVWIGSVGGTGMR